MKKYLILFISLIVFSLNAQTPFNKFSSALQVRLEKSSSNKFTIWVHFKDKGANYTKYFSAPLTVLSQKSIDRRAKYQIPSIDFSDIPVNESYIKDVLTTGAQLRQVSKWFNSISLEATREQIESITKISCVNDLDIVYGYKSRSTVSETPVLDNKSEPLNVKDTITISYGNTLTQLNQIKVPQLHALGYHGEGIYIGVMDAGFNNLAHECFAQLNKLAQWDFVNHNWGVGDSTDMGDGTHGTETLSTIGGFKNGKQIGPAFKATYILAKTENTASETPIEEDNWVAAAEWADSIGVDVTSTSLGYLDFDSPYPSHTWQDMNGNTCKITIAADLAVKKGIIVVNSAGNDGNDVHNTLGAPADGDSVITVGAVSSSGTRVYFSSVGPTVDGRIKPDVMAMGSSVYAASSSSTTGYTLVDGTSFSCPLTAGLCALLLQAHPLLTPIQIRASLWNTASVSTAPNNLMGYGIANGLAAYQYYTPVELTSFTGKALANGVQLNWQTATEVNNRGFEVQRKTKDETNFSVIGFVTGNGTTTESHNYSFVDKTNGNYIYRLKQVDNDGTFQFSNLIEVGSLTVNGFQLYQNYPNPFNPSTVIKYDMPKAGNVNISLYNIIGSKIKTISSEYKEAGSYTVTLDGNNLAAGIYFVKMVSGNFEKSIKITLLK